MNFSKSYLEKYADVIIWGIELAKKKTFVPYESVLVRYDPAALPLLEVLYKKLIQKSLHVIIRTMLNPVMEKDFFLYSDANQRQFIPPGERELYKNLHGSIYLIAPSSLTHLKNIDTTRINEATKTKKILRDILDKREENGDFNWTLCIYPTPALAEQAGLSLEEYTNQLARACFLNEKSPITKWQEVYRQVTEIKKWLYSLNINKIFVESKSCNLEITLGEKRRFVGVSGHNIPSFEIFTSPDWRGTQGTYFADQPSFRNGNLIQGVELVFEKGRVIKAGAAQGEMYLKKTIAMDAGASQIGEFSLTDKRFSRINKFMANTLFDENYGGKNGNCHLALGSSYSDTFAGDIKELTKGLKKRLGYNDSALHWDLVNTEEKTVKAILADGKKLTIYEKGMFAL
jgi:aminopeptidase